MASYWRSMKLSRAVGADGVSRPSGRKVLGQRARDQVSHRGAPGVRIEFCRSQSNRIPLPGNEGIGQRTVVDALADSCPILAADVVLERAGIGVDHGSALDGRSAGHRAAVVGRVADRHLDRRAPVERRYGDRSEEHTSELQSLMRISYAVFCLKKKSIHQ